MPKRITVIDGHPDPDRARFVHALADAYVAGAEAAGHTVKRIDLAQTEVPFLRTSQEWGAGQPAPAIRAAQDAIGWAEHLVILFPLWHGSMPALLKAFFEQTFRPGFAVKREHETLRPGLLGGRSARIVMTMGMPAWAYRWYFRAHSLKSLERNILRFSGIGPIRETLIGSVEAIKPERRQRWLAELRDLGAAAR